MISAAEAQVVGCPLPASVVDRTEWILILVALSFRPSSALAASAMDMGLAETSRKGRAAPAATARTAGRKTPGRSKTGAAEPRPSGPGDRASMIACRARMPPAILRASRRAR